MSMTDCEVCPCKAGNRKKFNTSWNREQNAASNRQTIKKEEKTMLKILIIIVFVFSLFFGMYSVPVKDREITVTPLPEVEMGGDAYEAMPYEYVLEDTYETGYVFPTATYVMNTSKSMEMERWNTEEYTSFTENGFVSTATSPLSTFAADVDTSSYARLRRMILNGESVPESSVRIEEMLNYFHYHYPQPKDGELFGVYLGLAECPWNKGNWLFQIGLQAATTPVENRPEHNLVFLIDTSGSMDGADRLDLVKRSFQMLLDELAPTDTVSVVAYASQDRVVLDGAKAADKTRIMEAISELEAEGYTNGTAGLLKAYDVAEKYFIPGGVNRILLATDGDLNVGVTSESELAALVEGKKKNGVSLTVMGFGYGNYKDNKLEALADHGDGNCWFIDTILEARKALVTEADGTFQTMARDVKLQVDFNPAYIAGYRLIGYEDRVMSDADFANDEKDGGEIGSGHRVTALYELVPAGKEEGYDFNSVKSRYVSSDGDASSPNLLTLSVRAKTPEENKSELFTYDLPKDTGLVLDDNMKYAAAVTEVGMLLRKSQWKGDSSYEQALALLRSCSDRDIYQEEFIYLTGLLARQSGME